MYILLIIVLLKILNAGLLTVLVLLCNNLNIYALGLRNLEIENHRIMDVQSVHDPMCVAKWIFAALKMQIFLKIRF